MVATTSTYFTDLLLITLGTIVSFKLNTTLPQSPCVRKIMLIVSAVFASVAIRLTCDILYFNNRQDNKVYQTGPAVETLLPLLCVFITHEACLQQQNHVQAHNTSKSMQRSNSNFEDTDILRS